ncbi:MULTISPECIES: hypothetical protein [unclassified Alteromonas]|jgi:hypothetical protein|uniref:hypothetical protein n=1 Tax=Alteromonas sp. K632G TaxID=2820757 RepID=UPI001FCCA951|nr:MULTISPECIES: hypothetical protein [unclassified Alteromonas]|tara:strand:- start:2221 stop:2391 length:171 start_codon:yes stop_codon:yes gene_type:complete
MDRNSIYYKQVQLLMQVLPFVAKQECFALKGGTASISLSESFRAYRLIFMPVNLQI